MWRIALLCSVVALTVACTDGPGAPSASSDGPSLQFGDPPPPPLDGGGAIDFVQAVDLTAIAQQDVCVPPPVIPVAIEGTYFQNKSENMARVHFTPVEGTGTGSGTIHETKNDAGDPDASGTLVVMVGDVQVQIHLIDYVGTSLFLYQRGDFFGSLAGNLVARVVACGETNDYNGAISFSWVCSECPKKF
jgi:hypothetical protein